MAPCGITFCWILYCKPWAGPQKLIRTHTRGAGFFLIFGRIFSCCQQKFDFLFAFSFHPPSVVDGSCFEASPRFEPEDSYSWCPVFTEIGSSAGQGRAPFESGAVSKLGTLQFALGSSFCFPFKPTPKKADTPIWVCQQQKIALMPLCKCNEAVGLSTTQYPS